MILGDARNRHDPIGNAMDFFGLYFIVVPLFVQAFTDGLLIVGAWKEIKVLLGIWLGSAILGQGWLGWMFMECFIYELILFGIIGLVIFGFICFAIFVVIKNFNLIMKNQIEPDDHQPLDESFM